MPIKTFAFCEKNSQRKFFPRRRLHGENMLLVGLVISITAYARISHDNMGDIPRVCDEGGLGWG
jgi:hypothetical protein